MSGFDVNAITDAGSLLIAKVMASRGSITFTRIVMGDGYMPSSQIPEHMTAVVSPKAEMTVTKCEVTGSGAAVVGGRYDNSTQSQDFEWRELGLFAQDPDLGEILYSYGNAGEHAEVIPAGGGATAIEKLIDVITYVGQDVQVTAQFMPYVVPSADEVTITNSNNKLGVKAGGIQLSHAAIVDATGGFVSYDGMDSKVNELIAKAEVKVDGSTIDRNASQQLQVKDGGITASKVAAGAINASHIADGSVGTAELATGAVSSTKIENGAVGADKLATGAVATDKLAALAVTTDKLANASVGPAKLMQKSVQVGHISDAAALRGAMGLGNTLQALPVANGGTGQTTIEGVRSAVLNFPTNDELLTYLGLK